MDTSTMDPMGTKISTPVVKNAERSAAERINVTIQSRCRSGLMLEADVGWL